MSRALEDLKWATVGGLVAAVPGAFAGFYMQGQEPKPVYDSRPKYTANMPIIANTPESKERLHRLARNLEGKMLHEQISTTRATWIYDRTNKASCWFLNTVALSEFTMKISNDGQKITAEGQLPNGSCTSDHSFGYNHMVEIPLDVLPLDTLAKKYGVDK